MEEKDLNSLPDEALDTVTGGYDLGVEEPTDEIRRLWASMADGERRKVISGTPSIANSIIRRMGNILDITYLGVAGGVAHHVQYMCGTGNVGGATCRNCGSPIPANHSGGICPSCGSVL